MAGSLNKVMLIGNLGNEPEIRSMQDGKEMATLSIATSESWKDKSTGERRDKTEWHRVVVWNEGLVRVIKNYLHKGSKVFIEGQLQTRKWQDQSGADRYSTEIVLQGFNGSLTMLDGRNEGGASQGGNYGGGQQQQSNQQSGGGNANFATGGNTGLGAGAPVPELDDEIPF